MNNLILFFDGCHKIYYAEHTDTETISKMRNYERFDGAFSKNLDDLWKKSCFLKFVQPANLDFSQPYVDQGHTGGLRVFKTKLNSYFATTHNGQPINQTNRL